MYLHPHREHWKTDYLTERALIHARYGPDIALHHIGSTAVSGLFAKDCIDLLGVVERLPDVAARAGALVEAGYRHKGAYGIPGREYFSKASRKAHLHIFQTGDPNIARHLRFVQIMQGDQALIERLNRIKIAAHAKHPNDPKAYQASKSGFYQALDALLKPL